MPLTPVLPAPSHAALLARISAAVYPAVADLAITAWRTPEPVPYAQRTRGEQIELQAGTRWADRLFDCAWMRFRGTIPSHSTRPLALRIDVNGELCLVDSHGTPVRGLTCVHSVFDRSLGTPAKTIYRLPPALARPGEFEIWADAGFNDLFGSAQGEGRIAFAQLVECRDDVRALLYDVEVVSELSTVLPPEEPLAQAMATALQQIEAELEEFSAENVVAAREHLATFLRAESTESRLRVSAIGHAHLDLAWLWPIRETIRKGARTFATALYNARQYPEYSFGVSQPQLFAWMHEHHPALFAEIKAAVASHRIELLGTMWVEPDCNLPSGESLVRQILHGERYFREEFGHVPRFCWQPDVFGYNAQLPQILKKSGHEFFMTQKLSWNLVNKFPHHSFVWEGIDGSSVLAHMLPEETYNGPAAPRSLAKIAGNYAQRDVSDQALMVYGIGDGGGGPDAEHLERLRRERSLAGLPSVQLRPVAEFFERWAVDAAKFPRWKGELYLERHQGTFTTQAAVKKFNRQAEILLREVELASVLCQQLPTKPTIAARLDAIWKEVLLYQFHDILPGSSIKRVYDEVAPRYRALLRELEEIAATLWASLAEQITSVSGSIAFNPLPWPRTEWLKVQDQWHHVQVPSVGWTSLAPSAATGIPTCTSTKDRLENDQLRVVFTPDGLIASIQRKASGREFVAQGEVANALCVYVDKGDAWDFPSDYREQPTRTPSLVSSTPFQDGPKAGVIQRWRCGNSTLQQRISITAGSPQLEFETTVAWQESEAMLRVNFPVAVTSDTARYEIPYGRVRRSTRNDTSWEKAQIEVPAHQWVDLSESSHGVALLNDCKYGFRIKGHTIEMNLIRSVPHPGTPLINKDDRSAAARATHYTDQGEHVFRYALWPHEGALSEGHLTEAARQFNTPLRITAGPRRNGALPATASALTFDSGSLDLAAMKPAEAGTGWVVRLVNTEEREFTASVRPRITPTQASSCDLCERNGQSLEVAPDGSIALRFAPFEVKTLRFC